MWNGIHGRPNNCPQDSFVFRNFRGANFESSACASWQSDSGDLQQKCNHSDESISFFVQQKDIFESFDHIVSEGHVVLLTHSSK